MIKARIVPMRYQFNNSNFSKTIINRGHYFKVHKMQEDKHHKLIIIVQERLFQE